MKKIAALLCVVLGLGAGALGLHSLAEGTVSAGAQAPTRAADACGPEGCAETTQDCGTGGCSPAPQPKARPKTPC